MEDCERKYKEAFNMAVLEHKSDNEAVRESIERIFPQLKESDDEKIRKELISYFKQFANEELRGVNISDWIAWLQKQKTSEEALQYLRENHSPSEMSDFQAAMNIAVAKAYDKGYNDGLEKHGEHNPAWSEEDEKQFSFCCAAIELSNYSSDEYRNYAISFLESLKDRVGCEANRTTTSEPVVRGNKGNYGGISPNSAWSEEDEKIVGNIRSIIEKYAFSQSAVDVNGELCEKEYIEADSWLRSLKERVGNFDDGYKVGFSAAKHNQWKPSDWQMASITCAVRKMKESACYDSELVSLYQDLLKLKE